MATATKKKTAKKKTTKKTAAKKKATTRTRKAASEAIHDIEESLEDVAEASQKDLNAILSNIRGGFGDATNALVETGERFSDNRREVLLAVIENARVNAEHTFDTIRDVLEADSAGDSLRIQRDALRESIERQLTQVREVASLAADGAKHGVEPIGEYLTEMRDRVMPNNA